MSLQPLIEVLTRIYDAQVKLLEIAKQKQEIIMRDRTDELTKAMQEESKIIKLLAEWDMERSEAIRRYLNGIGMKAASGTTLTELSKVVIQASEKKSLLGMQSRLHAVTNKLKAQNDTNQKLIQNSLEFIGFTLELLTGAEAEDMTYQNPAHAKTAYKNRRMFDSRA